MEKKPKRQTRNRILAVSLELFNSLGEPNVTTAAIADELEISPGNLYYHFHGKDEIVEAVFAEFEREIGNTLAAPTHRALHVEDIWLYLHLMFEIVWKYRFIYRDLADLVTRYRIVETHFKSILAHKVRTAAALCQGLVAQGDMEADLGEMQTLSVNMALVATYWLSFDYVRDPRRRRDGEDFGQGIHQVMAMVAPFLRGEARELLRRLSREYIDN